MQTFSKLSSIKSFSSVVLIAVFGGANFVGSLFAQVNEPIANSRSGISISFAGVSGVDYLEEYSYHDKNITDRRTIYIKDTTRIAFSHNANNILTRGLGGLVGVNGADGIPNSGDEGTIRYRVDRDLNYGRKWAGSSGALHPAYSAPFSFAELTHAPGVPVVGAIGPVPNVSIADRNNFYYRGLSDGFGDEWHTITVADDDRLTLQASGSDQAWWASDGKVFTFVVNPKAPCFTIKASGAAQFYTTPAKAYFVPKIHEQVTYFSTASGGTIEVELVDIYAGQLKYKINGGSWVAGNGSVKISGEQFSQGRNVLEYYTVGKEANARRRVVVKNPAHPSSDEIHGRMMWRSDEELGKIKSRMIRAPYKAVYESTGSASGSGQNDWDANAGRGKRFESNRMLINAFHATAKGYSAKASGKSKSYAQYAKEMLLDHVRLVDPVGFELNHSSESIPARELHYRGYWDVLSITNSAFAYDMLIGDYRSDKIQGGITAVEDLLIRDILASFVLECLQWMGGWNTMELGMWGTSRNVGGLCAAIAMPSYNTDYYGVSGFNGSRSDKNWVPYPATVGTWKEILLDNSVPRSSYPNLIYYSGLREGYGVLVGVDGSWYDKVSYTSYGLVGQHLETLANVLYLTQEKRISSVENFFLRGAQNTLTGSKDNPAQPRRLSSITVVNSRFPVVTAAVRDWIGSLPANNENSVERSLVDSGVYGLIWYDDESLPSESPRSPSNLNVRSGP